MKSAKIVFWKSSVEILGPHWCRSMTAKKEALEAMVCTIQFAFYNWEIGILVSSR